MRRRDREVTELRDMLDILDKCEVMRIGMCEGGRPYIVPLNFAYEQAGDDLYIYFHCASKGRKLDIIAKNDNVCFEADCSFKLIEAEKPCEWSFEYQSVIGEGRIEVITDDKLKIPAMDLFMRRYGFSGKLEYDSRAIAAVTVLRLAVTSMTGKQHINNH